MVSELVMQLAFKMGSVMEIKLVFQNVMYRHIESEPKFKEKRFEVDEETKIGQLFTCLLYTSRCV